MTADERAIISGSFCRADVERIVDAGASRIGIVLGETATAHDWATSD